MYSRIYVHILEIAYSPTLLPMGAITPSKWHISPNCWQNISNTNIQIQLTYIPPIVGRIYPIQIYKIQGPNLPGPNLPPRGPICRGPICRGPICRQGAQSAGARFAKKWQIGPQKVRGPICRQIGEGPNLPRTLTGVGSRDAIACVSKNVRGGAWPHNVKSSRRS